MISLDSFLIEGGLGKKEGGGVFEGGRGGVDAMLVDTVVA